MPNVVEFAMLRMRNYRQVDPRPISETIAAVRERLLRAARLAGRTAEEITLLAVTKNVPLPLIREALKGGIAEIGENRVQEAAEKRAAEGLPGTRWHLIGHLQSNKAKKAVELFDMVQSLDSFPLAEILNREAEKRGKKLPCLVEIKVSEEPSKHGLAPGSLDEFLEKASVLPFLAVRGLMAVAPYFDDPAGARPYFAAARGAFEKHRGFFGPDPVLSMGMSHDFEAAVEEGANMIRIGTAIFGERPRP